MVEFYDGPGLLTSGQLSNSAEVYYAKGQMVQIFSHKTEFILSSCH